MKLIPAQEVAPPFRRILKLKEKQMRRNFILIALLALSFNAYATEREKENGSVTNVNASATSQSIAGAMALSGSASFGVGGSANNSVNVDNGNDRIIPVSSAIAPNLSQNVICPIISPSSHAVQLLILGGSTTGSQKLNSICVAFHLQQFGVVEKMTCKADKAYREANPNCQK